MCSSEVVSFFAGFLSGAGGCGLWWGVEVVGYWGWVVVRHWGRVVVRWTWRGYLSVLEWGTCGVHWCGE